MFLLKKFVTAVVLPPTSLLLLAFLGLILAARRRTRNAGILLAGVSLAGLLALSTPFVSGHLTRLAGDPALLAHDALGWAQAIVIPSCGVRRNALEYGTDVASGMSMDRIRYGAYLARRSQLPVLVTGGQVYGAGRPEAEVMRDVLEHDFGVAVKWSESRSRNTHENAVFSAALLREAGVSRIVLVTHAVDARRMRREFEAAGFEVEVAATMVPGSGGVDHWIQHLPSATALQGSTLAIYEVLAIVAMNAGLN